MEQKPYERVDADSAYAERLRDVLSRANVPAEQRVRVFLHFAVTSFDRSAEVHGNKQDAKYRKQPERVLVSSRLKDAWNMASDATLKDLGDEQDRVMKWRVKKIEEGWQYFKQQPLDDPIWLVLVSPSDPDDYIAFGDARLYWFDDDEKPSEEEEREISANKLRRTSSGASEYAKVIGKLSYIDYHPPAAAADADGATKSLRDFFFRLNRQNFIVADGGHITADGGRLIVAADVRKLPYRPLGEINQLEASRVCVLLNALREWLHDDTCDLEKLREEVGASQLQNQPITPQTLHFNLDCAAEHGANAKVLDEYGEKPSLFAPLDAPPPLGLKYLLGSGITLYLKLMGGCAFGFLLAGVVALPAIFDNANGGVLTSIGYDSIGTRFSLGNRLPYSVRFFPTQALDVLPRRAGRPL